MAHKKIFQNPLSRALTACDGTQGRFNYKKKSLPNSLKRTMSPLNTSESRLPEIKRHVDMNKKKEYAPEFLSLI